MNHGAGNGAVAFFAIRGDDRSYRAMAATELDDTTDAFLREAAQHAIDDVVHYFEHFAGAPNRTRNAVIDMLVGKLESLRDASQTGTNKVD